MSSDKPSLRSRMVVDVRPLRSSAAYRWLFGGLGLAFIGRQLTVVAVPFQIYEMTGSSLAVGMLGVVQFGALMLASPIGGTLADALDRRRLLLLSQLLMASTAGGLAWNAITSEPALWPLFVLSGLNAAISTVDSPTRAAVLPRLVGRTLLPSALALNQTLGNVARSAGPALAGILIARFDLALTYSIEAVIVLAGALMMIPMPSLPPEGGGRRAGWESIMEGFRFLKERRLLQANFVIDLNAMVFGMPRALFPAIGTEVLGGDASTVGLLFAAPGIGALVAALTSGWVAHVRRQGLAVVISVMAWGVSIALFGFVAVVWLSVVLLAIAGAADMVSAVFRNTILQLAVPDALRGRLSAIHIAVVAGGPRLGDFESGAVAQATSLEFSVVSGGLACIVGALALTRWFPELPNYTSDQAAATP